MSTRSAAPRILSQSECEAIVAKLSSFTKPGNLILPQITSWWQGELRWGRNRVTLSSDRREDEVRVVEAQVEDRWGGDFPRWGKQTELRRSRAMSTNQTDAVSLEALTRAVERLDFSEYVPGMSFDPPTPGGPLPSTKIWSDASYRLTAQDRVAVAASLIRAADAQKMLSAGYIQVRVGVRFEYLNHAPHYLPFTQARCSMTVRDTEGTGSGWAGGSSYDWAQIDAPALAARAVEKCVASRNPVALEPGRYTVILEPAAVAQLMEPMVKVMMRNGYSARPPFGDVKTGAVRWNATVVDPRITLSHDPVDPQLGIVPMSGLKPTTWIDQGKLRALGQTRVYRVWLYHQNEPVLSPAVSYRMTGSTTASIDEMIASTTRGVLVTRFSGIEQPGGGTDDSLLCTGLTRDGLWLIENGKITKAVKNFRFAESPLFMLNKVEQIGTSVPVFRPVETMDCTTEGDPHPPDLTPAIVPALKVRDFNFTGIVDAV